MVISLDFNGIIELLSTHHETLLFFSVNLPHVSCIIRPARSTMKGREKFPIPQQNKKEKVLILISQMFVKSLRAPTLPR